MSKDLANSYFGQARYAFLAGDQVKARKKYKKAANLGSVAALHNLGVMYLHGQGVPADYAMAQLCFENAAMEGVPESMNQLGYMYYYAKGVEQNYALARGWFLSSDMHSSHFYAQYHLGIMAALGQGSAQNWNEAAKWLQLSANQGFTPAIYNLGVLYFNGDGVEQSYDRALELYGQAATQGHSGGENNFAVMCAEGLGTLKKPLDSLLVFWEHAAAKNLSSAHYNLVNIHLNHEVGETMSHMRRSSTQQYLSTKSLPPLRGEGRKDTTYADFTRTPRAPRIPKAREVVSKSDTRPRSKSENFNRLFDKPSIVIPSQAKFRPVEPPSPFLREFGDIAPVVLKSSRHDLSTIESSGSLSHSVSDNSLRSVTGMQMPRGGLRNKPSSPIGLTSPGYSTPEVQRSRSRSESRGASIPLHPPMPPKPPATPAHSVSYSPQVVGSASSVGEGKFGRGPSTPGVSRKVSVAALASKHPPTPDSQIGSGHSRLAVRG